MNKLYVKAYKNLVLGGRVNFIQNLGITLKVEIKSVNLSVSESFGDPF